MKQTIQGCVSALLLILVAEGVTFGYDIARNWIEIHFAAPIKSGQRAALVYGQSAQELKQYCEDHRYESGCVSHPEWLTIAGAFDAITHPNRTERYAPLDPAIKAADPVTQSDVVFIEITGDQFEHSGNESNEELRNVAGQLSGAASVLPKGTHYIPSKINPDDPSSIVVITGADGTFGLPVKLRTGKYVMIPATEYRPYLTNTEEQRERF